MRADDGLTRWPRPLERPDGVDTIDAGSPQMVLTHWQKPLFCPRVIRLGGNYARGVKRSGCYEKRKALSTRVPLIVVTWFRPGLPSARLPIERVRTWPASEDASAWEDQEKSQGV